MLRKLNSSQMAVGLLALRTSNPLPQESSWCSFLLEARIQGHRAARRIRWIEICNDLIRSRRSDLQACSILSQPSMLPRTQQFRYWRMASSGKLRREALVRTDISEELNASIIRVTRIGELGTTLAVTGKLSCHPDNGGAEFLRNVGSYKSHTA
jgi:hypothetical protein